MRPNDMPRPFAPDHSGQHDLAETLRRLFAMSAPTDNAEVAHDSPELECVFVNERPSVFFSTLREAADELARLRAENVRICKLANARIRKLSDEAELNRERVMHANAEIFRMRAQVSRLSGINLTTLNASIAIRINEWFKQGRDSVAMLVGEVNRECPYDEGSLASHWWSRGFTSMARNFRAVEAERERDELRRRIAEAPKARPLELQCMGYDDPDRDRLTELVKSGARCALVRLDAEEGK